MPKLKSMPLLSAMPMGALILDRRLAVQCANRAFVELLGHPEDQIIGHRFDALAQRVPTPALMALLSGHQETGTQVEVQLLSAQGEPLAASILFSAIREGARPVSGLLGIVQRQQPERPEGHRDRDIQAALALAQIGSWELEVATGRIHASPGWLDILGLEADAEPCMDQTLQRVHPQDRGRLIAAMRATNETGEAFHIGFRVLGARGRIRWVECTGHLDETDPKLAGRIHGALMDVTERRTTEQTLARYCDIFAASPDRIAFLDRGCRILAANPVFLQTMQCQEERVIGRPFKDICADARLTALLYRNLGRCLDHRQIIVEDIREAAWEGGQRDVEVRFFPHREASGAVTGIVINIRDVTAIREAERRLLQSAAVYAATSEGVLITDASGTIVAVNTAFTQITGYSESEVLGLKPSLLNSHWHPHSFFVGMWRRLLRHGSWQGEIWNRRKDGEIYRQKLSIRRVLDARGKLVNFVGVFAERSLSPGTPQRVEHQIHYDALTRLPNRLLFESRLDHAIELGRRKHSPISIFLIDLDHFSHINSSLGHQIGDELLRAVALRLREAIRPADTLARLRSDQFGLLFEEIAEANEAREIALRLQATLRSALWVQSHEVFVTVSIGVVLDDGLTQDREVLLAHAESALRLVKRQGRNSFRIATVESGEPAYENRRMIHLLRSSLAKGELRLLYRPGVDMSRDACDCVEAVMHWEHADLGVVPSERFVPLASTGGLTGELGRWALETGCRQLQRWVESGSPIASLALPITEAQLIRGDLIPTVRQLLERYPLAADRLELELSEALLVKHREQVASLLEGLNQLGVRITLSEVGAGWTAPAVLQRLPIKTLKIHASFIQSLPSSQNDLAVVETIIAMAQALGLEIRADGVRTDQQRLLLMNIGCQHAIGDLFGEPMPPAQLEAHLGERPKRTPPRVLES